MTASDIDPMTGWSRAMSRQMAESIKTARGIKPTSWAILPTPGGVQVNVGKRSVCAMDRHRLELVVDVHRLPRLDELNDDACEVDKDKKDKTHGNLAWVKCSPAASVEVLKLVRDSHLSAIRRLAQTQTSQRKRHDETLRKELERIGDVSISPPGYSDHLH